MYSWQNVATAQFFGVMNFSFVFVSIYESISVMRCNLCKFYADLCILCIYNLSTYIYSLCSVTLLLRYEGYPASE